MRKIQFGHSGFRQYFIDTEFYEDGHTIDLISLGVVCSDGRELYLCNRDAKLHLVSDWLRKHVLPSLPTYADPAWVSRQTMADRLRDFVTPGHPSEFWGYFADYDWVAICQMYGTMMGLPNGFPRFCMDLKQLMDLYMVKKDELPKQGKATEHNALADARWNRDAYDRLRQFIEHPL